MGIAALSLAGAVRRGSIAGEDASQDLVNAGLRGAIGSTHLEDWVMVISPPLGILGMQTLLAGQLV